MNDTDLGRRIREERLKLNLTQEQLAERLNVSTTYIGFLERGQRGISLETLIQLAGIFDVTVDYLLHTEDHMDLEIQTQLVLRLFRQLKEQDRELIVKMLKLFVGHYKQDS